MAGPTSLNWLRKQGKKLLRVPWSIRPRRFTPLWLEPLEDRLAPALVTWDGGGGDFDWNNRFNWNNASLTDPNTLPAAADEVQLNVPSDVTIVHASGAHTIKSLTASEKLTLSGGALTVAETATVHNVLRLTGGSLSAGTLDMRGSLEGAGTITGNVVNAGVVRPGNPLGTLTVTGNYTQTATGTLSLELGGTAAGSFDRLAVTGTANLAGTLGVSTVNGFVPGANDTFSVMAFLSRAGDFSTHNGLNLGNSRLALPVVQTSGLTLEVLSTNLQLPALTIASPTGQVPAVIALTGTFANGDWTLTGAGNPTAQYKLDGFVVENLAFNVVAGPAGYEGTGSARLTAAVGVANTPVTIDDLAFQFDEVRAQVEGRVRLLGTVTFGEPTVFEIVHPSVNVSLNGALGASAADARALTVRADAARLFPRQDSASFTASAEFISITVGSGGVVDAAAAHVELAMGRALLLTAANVQFHLDPAAPPDAVLAELHNLSATFPDYPDFPTGSISSVTVQRNRIAIEDIEIALGGETAAPATAAPSRAAVAAPQTALLTSTPQRPLLILPGIGGTYAADLANDDAFLLTRGIHPDAIQREPMNGTYEDLLVSLGRAGYIEDVDLFVANYDWRLEIGPSDMTFDGRVSGLTATQITKGTDFRYGVDYLGYWLQRAAESWEQVHGVAPDRVDVIAHSTGGVVARTYIQSDAYGGTYLNSANETRFLPMIEKLIMIGVPNRGASKAWNPMHDNWVADIAYRTYFKAVVNRAFQRVVGTGATITGPDHDINLSTLPTRVVDGEVVPDTEAFIAQYIPGMRALLATYPFLDRRDGQGVRTVNDNPQERNNLLLDLNHGLDLLQNVADPNRFAEDVGQVVVIAGIGVPTPKTVEEFIDIEGSPTRRVVYLGPIVSVDGAVGGREPFEDERWFVDVRQAQGGDGTVPTLSLIGQFVQFPRANVEIKLFVEGGNTSKTPQHTAVLYLPEVQRFVLQTLGTPLPDDQISTDQQAANKVSLFNVVLDHPFAPLISFVTDPIEAFLVDGQGRRVGFSVATGPLAEIPGSLYIGGADGMGFLPQPADEALTYQVVGLGGPFYFQAEALATESLGRNQFGGIVLEGQLAAGETRTGELLLTEFFRRFGIPTLLEVDDLRIQADLVITFSPAAVDVDGAVTVTAGEAALLPDVTTPELDGLVAVRDFAGTFNLSTGALDLAAGSATLDIRDVVHATAAGTVQVPGLSLHVDPNNGDSDAVIATIRNLDIELPGLPDLPAGLLHLDALDIRRNGFRIATTLGGPTNHVTVGSNPTLLAVDGLQVGFDVNVTLSRDPDQLLPQVLLGGTIMVHADRATLLPGQPGFTATVAGFDGSIDLADPLASLRLHAGQLTASVDDLFTLTAQGATLDFAAGSGSPLLQVDQATLVLPLLGSDVELIATDLEVTSNGSFSFTSAMLKPGSLLNTIGLGDLLPLDITSVTLSNNGQRVQLDDFDVRVQGMFDPSIFNGLPARPIVKIGGLNFGANGGPFDLTFSVNNGAVTVNLNGPVTLGFTGLAFGPVTVDATVTLGQFVNGHYVLDSVGASLDMRVENTQVHVDGLGTITTNSSGDTTLAVNLGLGFSFDAAPGGTATLKVKNFLANFDLQVRVGPDLQPLSSTVQMLNASVGSVDVLLGPKSSPLVKFNSTQVFLNLSNPSAHLLTFGSVTASLPGLPGAFAKVVGTVRNFAVAQDFSFVRLPGFGVELRNLPTAASLGLPAWLPLVVTGLGLELGPTALQGNPLDFVFIVSGGLVATQVFPISATVTGLRVNVGKLAEGKLLDALEGLDSFFIGVQPFQIGSALKIGGGLGLGIIKTDDPAIPGPDQDKAVLYGRIKGYFEVSGIGAGVELVFTEVGPLLGKVDAPLAMPLGPTGILLSGVSGGIAFGVAPVASPPTPLDLLSHPVTFQPISLAEADVRTAILAAVERGVNTWRLPFTVALQGHFTTIATPGIVDGTLTIAATVDPTQPLPAVKFLGSGQVQLFGLPLGVVGALLDLTDPIAPIFNFAFAAPAPGNPLAFLLPAQGTFTVHLDTTGLVRGPLIGLETFVNQLATGTLSVVLDRVAQSLDADRTRPLAKLLLAGQGTVAKITAAYVRTRMRTLLPTNVGTLPATFDIRAAATLGAAFLAEMLQNVETLTPVQRTDLLQQLGKVLSVAGLAALGDGWTAFNPRLEITGMLQPTILGIPFGEPEQEVRLVLDKGGLGFGFTTSLAKTVRRLADASIPLGGFVAQMLGLGFSDSIGLDFKLGLGNVFQSLLAGTGLPAINPLGDWLIGVTGALEWFDFTIGSVTGFVFSPGSPEITARTQVVDQLASNVALDPNKIPIATQLQFNNLFNFGGFLLTGQLRAPRLVVDPLSFFTPGSPGYINFTPTVTGPQDLFNFGPYIDNIVAKLLFDEEFARMQLFLPSFGSLLNFSFSNGFTTFAAKTGAQFQTLMNAAYLTGFADHKLLSIPLFRATVDISAQGLLVTSRIPLLANLTASFGLGFRDVNVNELIEDLAAQAGLNGLDLTNTSTPILRVPIPVATAGATLDTNQLRQLLATAMGLPASTFTVNNGISASANFYSPAYGDPTDPAVSAAKRNGGVEIDARMNIPGLVNNAAFHFELPLFTGTVVPNFTAKATLDRLWIPALNNNPLLSLTNFNVTVKKLNSLLSADLTGTVSLLGKTMTANGSIRFSGGSMFGALAVTAGTNRDFGTSLGFKLNGNLFVEVNTSTVSQTVTLANGQSRTVAPGARLRVSNGTLEVGGFTLTGTFDLQVSGTGLTVTADATMSLLSAGTFSADGTLEVKTFSGVSGLVVDVALAAVNSAAVLPSAAAPSLIVSGLGFNLNAGLVLQVNTFNTPKPGLRNNNIPNNSALVRGTGSLQLKQGTTNSFKLDGTFDIRVSPVGFTMTADATLNLFGAALTADGSIDVFASTASAGQRGIALDIGLVLGSDSTPSFDAKNGSTPLNFRFNTAMRLQVNGTNRNFRDLDSDGVKDSNEVNLPVNAGVFRVHANGDLRLKIGSVESFKLNGTFVVTVSGTSFSLTASATTSVLGITFTINQFSVSGSGSITMSAKGSLQAGGYTFGSVTLDLHKVNNVFRLELPSARAVTVDLGFIDMKLSGFVQSTGDFSFSGSASVNLIFITGTVSATITDSGFSGTITGTLEDPIFHIRIPVGPLTVSSSGTFTYNFGIGIGTFTFNLGLNSFPLFPNRSVTTPIDAGELAVLTGVLGEADVLDSYILEVNWGDGTPTEQFLFQPDETGAVNGRQVSFTHTYLNSDSPGGPAIRDYTIALLWRDQQGAFRTGNLTVTVDSLGSLVDSAERWVNQVYRVLLNRPAEAAGLTYWASFMDEGMDRDQVVLGIKGSQEAQSLAVQQAYERFLGRPADPEGLSYHERLVAEGGAIEALHASLIGSAEYFENRGGGTHEGYLNALYQDVLARAVDPSGRDTFSALLAAGMDHSLIAASVFDSAEYRQILVQDYYQDFLARAADPAGLTVHVDLLAQGAPDESIIASILSSSEFFVLASPGASQRFVSQAYRDLLEREADAGGLAYFSSLLDQGLATPTQIALALEESSEHRTLVVQELYSQLLDRLPEAEELNEQVPFLMQGGTVDELKASLLGSTEYFLSRAGGTNEGFLEALYLDVLGRPLDPIGRDEWSRLLALGTARAAVATAVLESVAGRQAVLEDLYAEFLGRPADASGLDFFVASKQRGMTDEALAAAFLASDEYFRLL